MISVVKSFGIDVVYFFDRARRLSPVTTTPLARPDYEAHARATRSAFPTVVQEIREILGARLCAYLGSVKETRAVHQWAEGSRAPSVDVQRRLRIALQAASAIAVADSPAVAQAWFQGLDPHLHDRSPLYLLREGDLDEVGPAIIGAARSFATNG